MVKYREIIRLSAAGISQQNIAFSCGCAQSTVQVVQKRAKELKLEWPLPEEMDDLAIISILYPKRQQLSTRTAVDYAYVDKELHKRGVTLTLLWNEYCEKTLSQGGMPYQYTQFCDNYKKWAITNEVTMHIDHKPAEQIQVDWAGICAEVVDPDSSELLKVYIFVASLPCSGYLFAEGFYSVDSEAWIAAHVRTFTYFGGVTPIVVPDNCKAAIVKNITAELIINENYRRMAKYYGCAIVPTRVKRPKDKGHTEMSVGVVERQVIAALRNRVFFSLGGLNEAIAEKIAEINDRPFQKKAGSRTGVFLDQEKDALIPLPPRPYEIITRKRVTVNFNYHISFEGTYYSVPFSFVRREVEVAATTNTVSINCDGTRIATHIRVKGRPGGYVTNPDHMPQAHRDFVEWTRERFRKWAGTIGVSTHEVIDAILRSRKIEQQSYRSCHGVLPLATHYAAITLVFMVIAIIVWVFVVTWVYLALENYLIQSVAGLLNAVPGCTLTLCGVLYIGQATPSIFIIGLLIFAFMLFMITTLVFVFKGLEESFWGYWRENQCVPIGPIETFGFQLQEKYGGKGSHDKRKRPKVNKNKVDSVRYKKAISRGRKS